MLCLLLKLKKFQMLYIEIGPHHIIGNGVGFKPEILDMDLMEKVLEVGINHDKLLFT